jgi:hypothetical protein
MNIEQLILQKILEENKVKILHKFKTKGVYVQNKYMTMSYECLFLYQENVLSN